MSDTSPKKEHEPSTPAVTAPDFFINTSPEMDALERAAADGKHGRYYRNLDHEPARVYHSPGSSHFVKLELTESEMSLGAEAQLLKELTDAQDADSALAFLYISRLLAPPSALEVGTLANGKIDFDDVIKKIGWSPETSEERRLMHKRLYQFVQFGERAQVVGERRGKYIDKHTGQEIRTTIRSALWRIIKTETPEQQSLYPEMEVPIMVELVMSREWSDLLRQPQTAQYLPMGELLGAIPGNKPSGAWARVIGLALASFWRRLPRESLDGSIKPTRRELLERYTPKTGGVESVLKSPNPTRAINYWCTALRSLVEVGFLEDVGETQISYEQMRASLPRKNWSPIWLDQKVDLQPASTLRDSMKQRASAITSAPSKTKRYARKPKQ